MTSIKAMVFAIALGGVSLTAAADEASFDIEKDYPLGVKKFYLDHETRIIGWRVHKSVYFGQQKGEDSGLTLVWHQDQNQVSLSKDGLRLTRKF